MKLHRSLLKFTGVNFVIAVLVFSFSFIESSGDNRMLGAIFGWILWLGILVFVGPLCFSAATRAEWFSNEFGKGTLFLLFVNVLAAILASIIAYQVSSHMR